MDTGIRFHGELLKRIGMDPGHLHPYVKERPPPLSPLEVSATGVAGPAPMSTEEEHEVRDALAHAFDALTDAPGWWLLELLPMRERVQGPGPEHKEERALTYVTLFGRDPSSPSHRAHISYVQRQPWPWPPCP